MAKFLFAYDNGGNIYLISVAQDTCGYIYIVEAECVENKAFVLFQKPLPTFLIRSINRNRRVVRQFGMFV